MDWTIRRRVYSARKGQKRVESLGVRVSDLRSSVMRMDLGKARPLNPRLVTSAVRIDYFSSRLIVDYFSQFTFEPCM